MTIVKLMNGTTYVERQVGSRTVAAVMPRPYRARPLPDNPHAHPLVRQLTQLMNEQKVSTSALQRKAGVSHTTIGQWRRRGNPNLVSIEACFNVLGYTLALKPIAAKRRWQ